MSDLVLRAIGQAVCFSTVGIFALVMGLVAVTSSANSSQACRSARCVVAAAPLPAGFADPVQLKAVADHLWSL